MGSVLSSSIAVSPLALSHETITKRGLTYSNVEQQGWEDRYLMVRLLFHCSGTSQSRELVELPVYHRH